MASSSLLLKLYSYSRTSLFLAPWLAHLLVSDLLLSLLLPLSTLAPTLTYNTSSAIAYSVWLGIQKIFTRINRAHVIVSGISSLPKYGAGESAVVVSNHVAWTDFYMIQELALRAGMLGRCRWFAKEQLKWVPFLGWGLWAMGMPLVSRRWTEDQREMNRVFRGVLQQSWPMWLIAYSEATRYTPKKRLEAEAWCRQRSKRLGSHLLYPRTKGFITCVQTLRKAPHVKAVYDVTIAYAKKDSPTQKLWVFQQPPSFGETVLEPKLDGGWKFFVHVDRHALEDLPGDEEKLAEWLEERWVEKGERLEKLRVKLEKGESWDELA